MAIDSLGVSNPATSSLSQSTVSQSDLFKILLTQLKYQDPLKPTDNSEFIAQLAQFTGLDQSRQTNENIQSLLQLEATNQSIGLIGKNVEVTTSTGSELGQVTTISFASGQPLMTVKTTTNAELTGITLAQIKTVR